MKSSLKVLIVGGGPSGLTAAYHCGKKNIQAICFEADNMVGGLSRTVEHKGFRFDVGGHRFFTKIESVKTLWDEILGDEFLKRDRLSRIYYNERYFDHPLQPINALTSLGIFKSCKILTSYIKARLLPFSPEDSFEKWVSNRFGKYLYTIFFKTYTEKVWGIPCDQIQAEWATQRIKGLSLWSSVSNSLYKPKNVIKSLISEFHYPRLGPGQMYETMAHKSKTMGNEIRINNPVVKIHHDKDVVTSISVFNIEKNITEVIHGTDVISSMPLPELVQRLDPPAPDYILDAAKALRFRSLLTINLLIDQPQKKPDNWLYIHDPSVKVGRIQFFANWSPAMVPDPEQSSIGMEYFCWENDPLWKMSDGELIKMGKNELNKLGIIDTAQIFDAFVIRMPKSYPLYDNHFHEHVEVLKKYLEQFSNLHPCGRYGLFKYNNMDHSILTAIYAVENILGAHHDVWSVNTDDEYYEETGNSSQG